MKALLLSLMILLSPFAASANKDVFVLADTCYIYEEASYSSSQLQELEHGDILSLLSDEMTNGFYFVSYTFDDQQIQGYVPADVVGEKLSDQEVITGFNATLSEDVKVLSLTSDEQVCELKKGTRIFLYEGFDKSKDFLAAKFYFEGEVIYGRIARVSISPDGINPGLIVAIMAIVAIVTIIIILFGITSKKRHKKLKTQS